MSENELLEKIEKADKSTGIKITPRELLAYFGQERRTKYNNSSIKKFLQENDLVTIPDFLIVYMDSQVILRKNPNISKGENKSGEKESIYNDPVPRIQLLPSANRPPVSIKKEDTLEVAATKMLLHDYSQLPVMSGTRQAHGLITWETIANYLIHGGRKKHVKDCMTKEVDILPNDTPLFDAVKIIIQKEIVLIKDERNEICGIVTATDISEQFVAMSEPFLIIEQIENHIRILLNGKFSIEELKKSSIQNDSSRKIESIADLTFGNYIRLIENPEKWEKMDLAIDRVTFVNLLTDIKNIRNDVMHFIPDGLSPSDTEKLRKTSLFFQNLTKYMKTE